MPRNKSNKAKHRKAPAGHHKDNNTSNTTQTHNPVSGPVGRRKANSTSSNFCAGGTVDAVNGNFSSISSRIFSSSAATAAATAGTSDDGWTTVGSLSNKFQLLTTKTDANNNALTAADGDRGANLEISANTTATEPDSGHSSPNETFATPVAVTLLATVTSTQPLLINDDPGPKAQQPFSSNLKSTKKSKSPRQTPPKKNRRRNSNNPADEHTATIRSAKSANVLHSLDIDEDDDVAFIEKVPFLRRMKRRSRNSSSVQFAPETNDIPWKYAGSSGGCTPTSGGATPTFGHSPKFSIGQISSLVAGQRKPRRRSSSEGCTGKQGRQLKNNLFFGAGDCGVLMEGVCGYERDSEHDVEFPPIQASPSYTSILSIDSHFDDECYDEIELDEDDDEYTDYPAWRPCSQRWRARFESLAETPVSELRTMGDYIFSDSKVHLAISTASPSHQSGVFLALNALSGQEVCLKKAKMPKDMQTREFIAESMTHKLLELKHENLVQYLDYVQKKPNLFFVSKLYMGNLRHWVCGLVNSAMTMKCKDISFKPPQMCWDLINGMNYLKNSCFQLVHGNLTPQNILLSENGRLAISDPLIFKKFRVPQVVQKKKGCSKTEKKSEGSNSSAGRKKHIGECYSARAWNAPELLNGDGPYNSEEPTFQSDMFSLGLCMFYIYTYGEHPFAPGDDYLTTSQIRENVLSNVYDLSTRLPPNEEPSTGPSERYVEKTSFENVNIEERIIMTRCYELSAGRQELMKSIFVTEPGERATVEGIARSFKLGI